MHFSLPSKPPYPTGIICSDLQTGSPRFLEAKRTEEKRALWPQTPSFNHDPTTFPSCEPTMPPGRGDVTSPVLSFRTARILPCMSRTAVTVKNIKLPRSASKGPQQQFSGVHCLPATSRHKTMCSFLQHTMECQMFEKGARTWNL